MQLLVDLVIQLPSEPIIFKDINFLFKEINIMKLIFLEELRQKGLECALDVLVSFVFLFDELDELVKSSEVAVGFRLLELV